MKLEYKILWVEDEVDYVNAFPIDRVNGHIRDSGFEPSLEHRSNSADVRRVVEKNEFDLLVVDFRITDEDFYGSDLIQQIRQNDCLTEVVFYSGSARTELHREAGEKGLEGIYFGPKDPDGLVRKITDVFDLTVRKVLDVNNMRGFVMAGVAELDMLLDEIIKAKHSRIKPEQQKELRQKLVHKMLPQPKILSQLAHEFPPEKAKLLIDALKQLQEHEPASFDVLSGRRLDSSKRYETVVGFCNDHIYLNDHKEELVSIIDLLHWRNALAHQRPTYDETGLSFHVGGKAERFDDGRTLQLRKDIQKYLEKLSIVLAAVNAFDGDATNS